MKKFIRVHEVASILGIGKSTVWLWEKENKLPRSIKISQKVTVWCAKEISDWAQNRLIESRREQ